MDTGAHHPHELTGWEVQRFGADCLVDDLAGGVDLDGQIGTDGDTLCVYRNCTTEGSSEAVGGDGEEAGAATNSDEAVAQVEFDVGCTNRDASAVLFEDEVAGQGLAEDIERCVAHREAGVRTCVEE